MDVLRKIAEKKIREAMERGDFDNLSGSGRPLVFEDETWIPEDLRVAYRILRNAGCLPPELEMRNEIISLRNLINSIDDEKEKIKKIRELNFKLLKLNTQRKKPLNIEDFPGYEKRIIEKLT